MMRLYPLLRTLAFKTTDAEWIHDAAMALLARARVVRLMRRLMPPAPSRPVSLWGLEFRNPVGLAAGFDKNAAALGAWAAMGFGFVEIGTVTPRPQHGNPKPRIHRFPAQRALVNSMGFPNDGAAAVASRLAAFHEPGMPVGANLGKNRGTAIESAPDDYIACLRALHPFADYFVLNISSPNTPGLRHLQDASALRALLEPLAAERNAIAAGEDTYPKPLLVKIAPDLDDAQVRAIVDAALDARIDGIVATNTTTDHSALPASIPLAGGLSGRPLRDQSTRIIRLIRDAAGDALPIIGCGGVFTRDDLQEKLDAGASLVQVYTGFVYEGPLVAHHLCAAGRRPIP
jgi:dihydroorotate dehydrogenase